jgi:Mg/Co/Ni transporter MgtE
VNNFLTTGNNLQFIMVYLLMPMMVILIMISVIASNQIGSSFVRSLTLNRYDRQEIAQMIGKEFVVTIMNLIVILGFNVGRLALFY